MTRQGKTMGGRLTRDHWSGALLVVTGVAVAVAGVGYGMGTLRQMGSGFFPVVLGVLLALVGAALLATAAPAPAAAPVPPAATPHLAGPAWRWRGWLCILGGVLAFAVLGQHGGLVPASFVAVFIAALGDRGNSLRDAAGLAATMTAAGVAVFHYGLHLLLPLFAW